MRFCPPDQKTTPRPPWEAPAGRGMVYISYGQILHAPITPLCETCDDRVNRQNMLFCREKHGAFC